MKRRVIVLGDSFTFGHGCSDRIHYYDHKTKSWVGDLELMHGDPSQYAWPTLLQKHFSELHVVNLARPGRSNQMMFRDLREFYVDNPAQPGDIVIFNGSFMDRIEISSHTTTNPPYHTMSWCLASDIELNRRSPDYDLARKLYVTYLYQDDIGVNQTMSALMGAYGYTVEYESEFFWSLPIMPQLPEIPLHPGTIGDNIWELLPASMQEKQITFILSCDFSGVNDTEYNETQCRSIDFHVNDLGHAIYFEKQIMPVIEDLLNKS